MFSLAEAVEPVWSVSPASG